MTPKRRMLTLLVVLSLVGAAQAQTVLTDGYSEVESLTKATLEMNGYSELRITGSDDPLSGCTLDINSVDAWVFLPNVAPSTVEDLLDQFRVSGEQAELDENVKVVQYGEGAVVIPYPADFQPLTVYDGENFTGDANSLSPFTAYGILLDGNISSFVLKRGYMATLAQTTSGTGVSLNYVAADGDLKIGALPDDLNNEVRFIRVYPWHWVGKKGSCDIDPEELDAKWYYNWNLTSQAADPDYEYVAIKQQRWWPGLPDEEECEYLGVNHVSGYNEPDNSVEDAYESLNDGDVATAVSAWTVLEGTGLRIGAPAVTDGGYSWIVEFMEQAEDAGRRVDYVPIHYYRSYSNNSYAAGAAAALETYLRSVYDATHKPIWLTEFNNGANWTTNADPSFAQNKNCIEAMIEMMDEFPWVERYSIYSAVEECRQVYYDAGGYTPMGKMYKAHESPVGYQQILPGAGMDACASYDFENNLDDTSGSGNHALSKNYPTYVTGYDGGTAVQFNGVDDHLILPDSLSDSDDFTFAAWIYWDGGDDWQRIFDFGVVDSDYYMFLTPCSGSDTLRFAITTGGWSDEQRLNADALSEGVWTHVAVTLSGNTGRLYVNGTQEAVNTSLTVNPSDLGAIQHYLGRSMFPDDPYFSGRIDEVVIKDEALSASQVAALMTSLPPVAETNLIDGGSIDATQAYSTSVAGSITDPEGEDVTYSKVYGSDWLSVSSDGTLSGTPSNQDAGTEYVTIRGEDPAGACSFIVVEIEVVGLPYDFESGPVAYWDFADDGASDGAYMPGNGTRSDLDGDGAMDSDDFLISSTDLSGNGNHLTAWTSSWMTWSSTSTLGDYSMICANSWPAASTDSAYNPDVNLIDAEAITPDAWTVEVEFRSTDLGDIQTLVGRDGSFSDISSYGDLAALYLSIRDTDLAIEYVDKAGNDHRLQVAAGLSEETWYHVAATSDGTTLSLWLDGEVIGTLDLSDSANSALALGYGMWSVSRGMFSDAHVDRFWGYIDAVAISGVALDSDSFVIAASQSSGRR